MLSALMLEDYSTSSSAMTSQFFYVASIYWKSTSYRLALDLAILGKLRHRSALSWLNSFLGTSCMLFDLSIVSRLRHVPLAVAMPTHRSGLVRHGYPWVPTYQGLGRPRQVSPAHQKTRRPVSRSVRPDSGPNRPDLWSRRLSRRFPQTTLSDTDSRLGVHVKTSAAPPNSPDIMG